jgi:hypothetical protein
MQVRSVKQLGWDDALRVLGIVPLQCSPWLRRNIPERAQPRPSSSATAQASAAAEVKLLTATALSLLYKRPPTCVSLYPLVTCINVVKCFEYKRGAKSVAGLAKVCRAQGKAPASRGLRCGAAPRQRFFQHSERSSRWMQCGTGARGQPLPLESFCLRP